MEKQIHIKQERFGNRHVQNKYKILYGATEIGELAYKKKGKVFILGYIYIFPEYQKQGFGMKVIEYILSHYKVSCIVGETLETSRGFWKKCIQLFNGQRRNIGYCENCTSSFVIPKCKIENRELYDFLKIAYNIN